MTVDFMPSRTQDGLLIEHRRSMTWHSFFSCHSLCAENRPTLRPHRL